MDNLNNIPEINEISGGKNKKNLIIITLIIVIIIVSVVIIGFNFFKTDDLDISDEKNDEIYQTVDEDIYANFFEVAKNYVLESNLTEVSGQFLLNQGLLSEEYSAFGCFMVDGIGRSEFDCTTAYELVEIPTLVIRYLSGDDAVLYTPFVNSKYVVEFDFIYDQPYEFQGIYSEFDELLFTTSEIDLSEIKSGKYRYYYNDTYIEFGIYIDNDAPVFDYVDDNGVVYEVYYDDKNDYTTYYYMSESENKNLKKSDFKNYDDFTLVCDTKYYVYTYAVDAALNESEITYHDTFNYDCKN